MSYVRLAPLADARLARHAIFPPQREGKKIAGRHKRSSAREGNVRETAVIEIDDLFGVLLLLVIIK